MASGCLRKNMFEGLIYMKGISFMRKLKGEASIQKGTTDSC